MSQVVPHAILLFAWDKCPSSLAHRSHAGMAGRETLYVALKKIRTSRVQTVRTADTCEEVSAYRIPLARRWVGYLPMRIIPNIVLYQRRSCAKGHRPCLRTKTVIPWYCYADPRGVRSKREYPACNFRLEIFKNSPRDPFDPLQRILRWSGLGLLYIEVHQHAQMSVSWASAVPFSQSVVVKSCQF